MQKLPRQVNLLLKESELVFATPNIGIYQNDSRASFILRFHRDEVELKLCTLLAFRRKIMNIDLTEMFMPDNADIEIIEIPQLKRIFVFSLREILELRELFSGTMTMLEMNSIIHEKLVRNFH